MTTEEKKIRLQSLLAESRSLILDIGADPYTHIQPPTSNGSMGSAANRPEIEKALTSLEAAKTEIGMVEIGIALIDYIRRNTIS